MHDPLFSSRCSLLTKVFVERRAIRDAYVLEQPAASGPQATCVCTCLSKATASILYNMEMYSGIAAVHAACMQLKISRHTMLSSSGQLLKTI